MPGVASPNTVSSLSNGTQYAFIVTAVNSYGESVASAAMTATPSPPGSPPGTPTISSAVSGSGQVTVSWNTVTGATSYNLYYASGSNVTTASGTKVAGVASPNTVGSLNNGTQYAFIVTAVNSDGESVASNIVVATPVAQSAVLGSAGFSAGVATYISLGIDFSGTPYVAYADAANGNKATVMKYNGSIWVVVGSGGFSAGAATCISLAVDPGIGTPYVAYQDNANGSKATVMKYDGSSWIAVGSAGFSTGTATYTSIAIDQSGIPYIAFMDGANGYKATVMKYNGSNWVAVGSPGFLGRKRPLYVPCFGPGQLHSLCRFHEYRHDV